jgi:hypothetical protein
VPLHAVGQAILPALPGSLRAWTRGGPPGRWMGEAPHAACCSPTAAVGEAEGGRVEGGVRRKHYMNVRKCLRMCGRVTAGEREGRRCVGRLASLGVSLNMTFYRSLP